MTSGAETETRQKSETYFAVVFKADGQLEITSLPRRTVRGQLRGLAAQLFRGEIQGLYVCEREASE